MQMSLKSLLKPGKKQTAPDPPPAPAASGPPQEVLEKYLAQVAKFTDLLPSIVQGSNQLNEMEKKHLEIIQDFSRQMGDIFKKQEVMASSSTMVLETSWDYKQVIVGTQRMLENLLSSFDQALGLNDQVEAAVERLGASVGQLSRMVGLMADLSTNIRQLSRNAEIMSYHSGASGRGFGIIAEKMGVLTGELEAAAGQTPLIDAEIKGKLEVIEGRVGSIRGLAGGLRDSTMAVRAKLTEIFSLNQNIIQGFEDIQQASERQKGIREKLLGGMADISELAERLGVSQEVVATVLATEVADAGQIDFVRDQLATARRLEAETGAPWAVRQLAIELFLMRSKLEVARSRWLDLNQSISALRQTVQSEERLPAQLLQELEGLFESIEQIGAKLASIDSDLSSTQQSSNEIEGKLSRADEDLKKWHAWLSEMSEACLVMEQGLDRLRAIGETVRSFAEQIKLLAFYSAVEAADMGQSGQDLASLVAQARELANKANADSVQLGPLLEQIVAQFGQASKLVRENLAMLERILGEVTQANWSLAKLKESAEQFELIGRETSKLIEQQRHRRQDLAATYTQFADSFQGVGLKLEELFRLLSRAAETLNLFGHFDAQLFDRIDRSLLRSRGGGTMRFNLASDPLTLDPALSTDATSNEVVAQLFEGLVQFDKGANVIPGIAWHWTISSDGLTWTFHLKPGVKFHNGRELTAEDVKYSLERLLNRDFKSPNAYFIDMIQGADQMQQGRARSLEGLKVVDPHCLVIALKSPYMPFLANLAAAATSIVPREEVERLGENFGRSPVGAGPYRLAEWQSGKSIVLEAFPDYHQQTVSADRIRFIIGLSEEERRRSFLQNELDQVDVHRRDLEEFQKQGKKIQEIASLNVQYICINVSKATPFAHKLVRQALNCAIDRQALIDKTELKGEAVLAKGVFPPTLAAYNQKLEGYPYDPEMARKLLADAGFPGGPPGEYLLDIRDIKAQLDRAELVRDYCLEVGIKLKLNPLGWRELLDRAYGGDSLLSFRGWSSDNGDPDNFLYPLFHSRNWGRPGNTAFFKSPLLDQMLDKALAVRNPLERLAYYREIERMIVEEAPWVFLYHSIRFSATQPWLHGFRARPMGAPRLKDCWLEPDKVDDKG
jgi:peptide/nickel transport system substrate-binding protein/oligopeptide transport system substrate-binding protein